MNDPLLTTEEAAAQLRMDVKTLLKYARARLIVPIRINARKILFRQSAVEKFIQSKES